MVFELMDNYAWARHVRNVVSNPNQIFIYQDFQVITLNAKGPEERHHLEKACSVQHSAYLSASEIFHRHNGNSLRFLSPISKEHSDFCKRSNQLLLLLSTQCAKNCKFVVGTQKQFTFLSNLPQSKFLFYANFTVISIIIAVW